MVVGFDGTLLLTAYREVATPLWWEMQLYDTAWNSGGIVSFWCWTLQVRLWLTLCGTYRVGRVGQTIELLLHLLQDVGGGAVLRFAVVDLIQDSIEDLGNKLEGTKHVFLINQSVQYLN